MCLVTPTRIPYTAPEDLFCYKILCEKDGELQTPFRNFPIKLGETYTAEKVDEVDNRIEGGFFHAYTGFNYVYKSADARLKAAVYLAVIPKGSKFFVNNDGTEVCATSMKVLSKVVDLGETSQFKTIATDLIDPDKEPTDINKTFDTLKESLTTIESIIKYARDNKLYSDILHKYEQFEEGSYEKNLYAYRLIVAVLTENEENNLTKGACYYPYVDFYTGHGRWTPDPDYVKVGVVISGGTSYIVVGGNASGGANAGLGHFCSSYGVSHSWYTVGFQSVSRCEIAEFISRHFGRLIFDLMYGLSNCDYRWAD